ncbi:hypothetical protein BIY24_12740 [Halobacteriovorax marinus]|nr:hypothetical protein BIY24_12740 [Halobacteriovorax marinus]
MGAGGGLKRPCNHDFFGDSMKKLIWVFFVMTSFNAMAAKGSVVECENAHANGSRIKLEFLSGTDAKATVTTKESQSSHLLEVVSKSRDGIFFKTQKGNLLKLASVSDSIELSQTANAFDVNFETANCSI